MCVELEATSSNPRKRGDMRLHPRNNGTPDACPCQTAIKTLAQLHTRIQLQCEHALGDPHAHLKEWMHPQSTVNTLGGDSPTHL